MTLAGATLAFEGDAIIALTGSDFGAGLPLWTAQEVKAGTVLRFGASRSGARGYLAVRGGIAVPQVLGSASAHVTTGIGGRPLRKGDILPMGLAAMRKQRHASVVPLPNEGPIRVTAGPQAGWFGEELFGGEYQVTETSNRMGIRLRGPAVRSPTGHMITEGVALGAVQIPPDGQPIILFVEHQTTGGYPKPANVISADLWRVGQLRPRDHVRFARVTMEEALELLRHQEEWIYSLLRL